MQYESDAKQLTEEVKHLHQRLRQVLTVNSQKIRDGKAEVEKMFRVEVDRLRAELSREFESSMNAKLELEVLKRTEMEMRKDLQGKTRIIDDLRNETQLKISKLALTILENELI